MSEYKNLFLHKYITMLLKYYFALFFPAIRVVLGLPADEGEVSTFVEDHDWRFESPVDICNKTNHFIASLADLKDLARCSVVAGDVSIENFKDPIIHLGDIQKILGSLSVRKSSSLVRMEAPFLESISGGFGLKQLTSLSLVSFPKLLSLQSLDWQVIPILSNINFAGTIEGLKSIKISDTSLTAISGFMSNELSFFDINNNRFLELISANMEKVTESLHISANARNAVVSLPRLTFAQNVSINDVQHLNLAELETVGASASLINNGFKTLKVPKLSSVKGTLSLVKNGELSLVDFGSLTDIGGGLLVANNTLIEHVNFLPKLNVIGGAIELVGNFKDASLKQLRLVKGSARVKSFAAGFDCAKWSTAEMSAVIRGGKIECSNAKNETTVAGYPVLSVVSEDGANALKYGLAIYLVALWGLF